MKKLLLTTIVFFFTVSLTAQGFLSFGAGTINGDRSENFEMSYFLDFQFPIIRETIGNKGFQNSNIQVYLVVGLRHFTENNETPLITDESDLNWFGPFGVGLTYNYKKIFVGIQGGYAFDASKGTIKDGNELWKDSNGLFYSPRIGVRFSPSLSLMVTYENLHVIKKPFESYNVGLVYNFIY